MVTLHAQRGPAFGVELRPATVGGAWRQGPALRALGRAPDFTTDVANDACGRARGAKPRAHWTKRTLRFLGLRGPSWAAMELPIVQRDESPQIPLGESW